MRKSCTEILRVAPQASESAARESHSSLFMRIADANDISPALLLHRKYASIGRGTLESTRTLGKCVGQSFNGFSGFTEQLVARTEELTQIENLRASTTMTFAPFASMNGLQRSCLAWSPEQLQKPGVKYYPLLWFLEPVVIDVESRKPLVSLCPRCRATLATMAGSSRVGECYRCRSRLDEIISQASSVDPVSRLVRSIDYEVWIAQQLGAFIKFQVSNRLPPNFDFSDTLLFWFRKFDISLRRAGDLGVSEATLSVWLNRRVKPRLRATLNLCWVFGVSLLDFLKKELPQKHDGKLQESIDVPRRSQGACKRRKIDKVALERELWTIIRENKYAMMPFSEIAEKRLRRGGLVVRQNFPDLAKAIAKRFQENRHLMATIRQEQFCASIKTVAKFLHARGIVPNHKTLAPYLDGAARLRCEWAIAALREAREELGYGGEYEQLLLAV